MTQFDAALRRGLMDANLAQYENVLQNADSMEPDFSPRYLRERMRLLADPWGWVKRREQGGPRRRTRLNWRLIAVAAALLLLSACAYAVVTGQFTQWFPRLGADPDAPEVTEEVLNRTGTVIQQSQTVDGATVTLNGAVWDGDYLRLSLTVESPDFPEELNRDSPIYTEECSLELPEEQRADYLRAELSEWTDGTSEDLEEQVRRYLEMKPSYFYLGFSQPDREGDTLTWEASMSLKAFLERPTLTLHLENIAIYEKAEKPEEQTVQWLDGVRTGPEPEVPVLRGPFDFTFTLAEPILPVSYAENVEVTWEDIPLRFTGMEIGVFDMNFDYEVLAPVNPIQTTRPEGAPPAPEPDPDKLDDETVEKAVREAVQGVWTGDGAYVDCSQLGGGLSMITSKDGNETYGNVTRGYPYPIDPAAVTAVNLGGVRVELSRPDRRAE